MSQWIMYIRERFFLPTLLALVAGITLSGILLHSSTLSAIPFLISFIGILLFFVLMRLMNDIKDCEKDRIAHPERALPRGFIKKPEAIKVVNIFQCILFAYGIVIWILLQGAAGLAYIGLVAYLWLMYRDFLLGHWLHRHPFAYGILLQLFIFPVVFFSATVIREEALIQPSTWVFATMLFGAFSCNDICRKLDPRAHPVLASYLHFYGFHRTYEIAVLTLAMSAMSAVSLNLALILLPCELLVLISLSLLFFQNKWFKLPEVVANLSLMLHAWAIVLAQFGH